MNLIDIPEGTSDLVALSLGVLNVVIIGLVVIVGNRTRAAANGQVEREKQRGEKLDAIHTTAKEGVTIARANRDTLIAVSGELEHLDERTRDHEGRLRSLERGT